MIGRKAIVGLCLLCALAFTAFAAQSASAAIKGTTAYTCKKVTAAPNTVGFSKEHCKPIDAVNTEAKYEHFAIAQDTTTKITGTNEKTTDDTTGKLPAKFHVVISGIEAEIKAETVMGSGSMTNKLDATTGNHYAHGTGILEFKEAAVVKPAGCSLEKAEVITKELTATTLGVEGTGVEKEMGLKFQPKEGTTFAEFNIVGATCPEALKGNYKVTGSVIGIPDGATTVFTREGTTEQGTLKARNVKAGIDGKLTIIGKEEGVDTEYTPLSVTTVTT